jgi:protein-arginine deiminase
MKNIDVYQVLMGDKELSTFNDLVQDQMDSLREEVEQKLRAKLPQCRPDFIEVPNIFYGGTPVERVGGGYALPNQMGVSLLPNSVNAISINDTVISPYPFNDVFQDDIINEYKKRGLRADFVDTFYYAHIGGGDLHCVTNTIHICNPRGR